MGKDPNVSFVSNHFWIKHDKTIAFLDTNQPAAGIYAIGYHPGE
jgi:hypothetical protein